MKSKIAEAIKLKYAPVALLWSDEKPEGALEFKEGRWGCVMSLLSSAAKGRVSAAGRESFGCIGGGVGLGFGDQYTNFPGGIEYFLSSGNPDLCKTEEGRKLAESRPDFALGERYIKTPELARKFVEAMPITDIPARYVIFKPLEMVSDAEEPKVIIFLANPDQVSALVFLANYARETTDNVIVPMAAACQQIGILSYHEAESDNPKAVLGLTDLSARKTMKSMVDRDILSFSMPQKMYHEMESNVEGSFLQRDTWTALVGE